MSAWSRVQESATVRSGRADRTVVKCGFADAILADLSVAIVFFYDRRLDEQRLASSLGEALGRVPLFAGRLREHEKGMEIVCTDEGVPLKVVDVEETLPEAVARTAMAHSGLVEHVDAAQARQGAEPPMRVQVSRLADGGTALGCSWHHAVGDMQSFAVLMQTWSALAAGAQPPEVVIVEDRDEYLDRMLPAEDCGKPGFRLVGAEEAAALQREAGAAIRANRVVQIYFGAEEAARLRDRFSALAGRRLSTSDALTGHLLDTVRRLDGGAAAGSLTVPVNVRRRVGLPDGLIGNVLSDVHLPGPLPDRPELLAAGIRAGLEDFRASHLRLRSNRAFLAEQGWSRLGDCVALGFDPPNRATAVSYWTGFGAYDIAFEGHRPVCVSPTTNLPLPRVAWIVEGFGGSGHLCSVSLPAALAAKLRATAGAELLHPTREPGDALPELAGMVRKLA